LTKEGFGFDSMASSVLGLPKVGSEMSSKDHQLGNVVLVSTARDGLVPMSSGPTLSASLHAQESITASLKASLKPEGSSPAPVHLFSGGSSPRVAEVGERLRLSRPMASISKSFQNYYRKAREGRAVKMDEQLFSDSVVAMRLDFAGGIPFPLSGAAPESKPGVALFLLESKLVQSSRVPLLS
jgi:hypothetical protein